MEFLRNAWYIIAWEEEVKAESLFHRTVLNEGIVLYRMQDGVVAALADRCPHRAAPLHLGKLRGDKVECGYHGLQFDRTGTCVANPHWTGAIPPGARVRSYPVAQRHSAIWVWPGEAQRADPNEIPDYSFLTTSPKKARFTGYLPIACNYELAVDNIMDLSHADYMHLGTLDTQGALSRTPARVDEDGNSIRAHWWLPESAAMGVLAPHLVDPTALVDQWLEVRWQPPALMQLRVGATLAGQPRSAGWETDNVHLMTPETDSSTHYFFGSVRYFDVKNGDLNEGIRRGVTAAFAMQDTPMLEAQQRELAKKPWLPTKQVFLQGDAGTARVRRRLEKLIHEEQPQQLSGGAV